MMHIFIKLVTFILFFYWTKGQGQELKGVNLDFSNPLIITSLFQEEKNSLFGWSSTLVRAGKNGQSTNSWIFIGDPVGNYENEKEKIKNPGVVWRCSLSHLVIPSIRPSCSIANINPILQNDECTRSWSSARCPGRPIFEYEEDNWTGGSLSSDVNKLVACAHRWKRGRDEDPLLNGLCYWFNRETMYTEWSGGKNDRVNVSNTNLGTQRLIPLLRLRTERQYTDNNLPDYSFGQAGFSQYLTADKFGRSELILGAPGIYVWKGAVIRYQDRGISDTNYNKRRLNSDNRPEFESYILAQSTTGQSYDYFGYAVTSGYFFSVSTKEYAGGAPRANKLRGVVTIFNYASRLNNYLNDDFLFNSRINIYGPNNDAQFGSYFGSVLLSINVNGDELDEILIGAPFFNTIEGGSLVIGDHGAVYMYSSLNRQLIEIKSDKKAFSRFGSAMTKLGDINGDGFEDFAIGAPYENENEGAIYIYLGRRNLNSEWTPHLKIKPPLTNILENFNGFGSSFSTPLDVDDNYEQDIAIGSYMSKSVVLFRSRPKLKFNLALLFYTKNSDVPISQLGGDVKEFYVRACAQILSNALHNSQKDLEVGLELSIEEIRNKERFEFSSTQNKFEIKTQFSPSTNKLSCTDKFLVISTQYRSTTAQNDPLKFKLFVSYFGKLDKINKPLSYTLYKPNENLKATQGEDVDNFEPHAPFPLTQLHYQNLLITSECRDPTNCMPDLVYEANFEDNGKKLGSDATVVLDWSKYYGIRIKVSNKGEPAFNPEIILKYNHNLYFPIESSSIYKDCSETKDESFKVLTCSVKTPIKKDSPLDIVLPVSLKGIFAENDGMKIEFRTTVGVKNDERFKKSKNLNLILRVKSSVDLIGSVSSPKDVILSDNTFTQKYKVILTGVSPISLLFMTFKFPVRQKVKSGKTQQVLFIEKPRESRINCEIRSGAFQDFSMAQKPFEPQPNSNENTKVVGSKRKKREISSEFIKRPKIIADSNTTHWGGCDELLDRCANIECKIENVHPGQEIEPISFSMRVAKSVGIIEENKGFLLVESAGHAQILFGNPIDGLTTKASSFSQTLLKFQNEGQFSRPVPLWVYIISGIGGLIILILIIFCLYKSGFFKREAKNKLEDKKAEIQVQVETARRMSRMSQNYQGDETEVSNQSREDLLK